jgi:hypothetical protein
MYFKCAVTNKIVESDSMPEGWVMPPSNWSFFKPIRKETLAQEVVPQGYVLALSSEEALEKLSAKRHKDAVGQLQESFR